MIVEQMSDTHFDHFTFASPRACHYSNLRCRITRGIPLSLLSLSFLSLRYPHSEGLLLRVSGD